MIASTRPRRLGSALAVLALGAACRAPLPLPDLAEQARGAPLLDEALRPRVSELRHPLLEAAPVTLADGLNPSEAAILAVVLNPDLVAARAARGEARAGLVAAGILPNPAFNIEVADPYGGGSTGLTDVVNLSLSIDTQQILTRWARIAAARGEVDRVDLDLLWQEWQVAQQARLETTRLAWLEQRVGLATTQLADETQTSKQLRQGFDAGDVTADQLGVQLAARESVRANLVGLEQAGIESRTRLLGLLGRPETEDLVIETPVVSTQESLPLASTLVPTCLERRLDLEALRRGYDAQEARLRQAVLEQFPNVSVGLVRQRNESRLKFLGGFVTVGLPIFDRNQAGVALAEATRARLRAEYEARVADIRNTVAGALDLLALAYRRLRRVTAALAPLTELEGDEADSAQSGDVDWLTYETIRLALLDQRLQQASLLQLVAETQIALGTACGSSDWPPRSGGTTP